MEPILIRSAINSDKFSIFDFCKNTFSWGDYIQDVWDYWLSEGNLLVIEKSYPIGMCHSYLSKNQIWIEGIRIDSNFRRQGLASKLVEYVELLAKAKQIEFSFMLIDTHNSASLSMAKNLNYKIFQTWNFYSLLPKIDTTFEIQFANVFEFVKISQYVNSWRWLVFDKEIFISLTKENKIIFSNKSGSISTAILTESEHFSKTLIVTMFSGSQNNTLNIISYIQNYAKEKNYEKIQILCKENLSFSINLEHKITFNLMKKYLH
ncbi:MAG: GNAT family N-acetyltransferase [Nitrosarchaeum sp.]|nr:GNAT family N-acetyltransferase [Nitrosarchaeum sp.]MBP0119928.1 GNAT family N-acetyltransferase [Nitrosarchaeum sp.]MBP0133934.1 GNAT family N-acetyltransferase [Nitrosarchaeum sp.]